MQSHILQLQIFYIVYVPKTVDEEVIAKINRLTFWLTMNNEFNFRKYSNVLHVLF